jgi:hypothetical protein
MSFPAACAAAALVLAAGACSKQPATETPPAAQTAPGAALEAATPAAQIELGKKLVTIGGCTDCHSPKTFTAQGAVPDETRLFSGHPAGTQLPPLPPGLLGPDGWGAVTNAHLTAWVGPWGTSFAINLTPDRDTGIGTWTKEMFIGALRTGKHFGAPSSRPILPPMPWQNAAVLTDAELEAMFAYFQSLPPIVNAIPDPLPPAGAAPAAP